MPELSINIAAVSPRQAEIASYFLPVFGSTFEVKVHRVQSLIKYRSIKVSTILNSSFSVLTFLKSVLESESDKDK